MSQTCETVKVVRKDHPDGYTEINKSDLKDSDKIYVEKQAKKPAKKAE